MQVTEDNFKLVARAALAVSTLVMRACLAGLAGVSGVSAQPLPSYAYVVAGSSNGPVVIAIDVLTDTVVGTSIDVMDAPTGYVAISPSGRFVYVGVGRYVVGTPGGNNDHRIAVVDTERGQMIHSFPVHGIPGGIALTPDGGTMYAYKGYDAALATHGFAVIALPTGEVRAVIPVPNTPGQVAVSPDGHTVVATNPTGLTFIDGQTNKADGNLDVNGEPVAIAFSPDSATMYVLVNNGAMGEVWRFNVGSRAVTGLIRFGSLPLALAISPDGRRLYTTDGAAGSVFVVDTELWQDVTEVAVGPYAGAIAVTPTGDKIYVVRQSEGVTILSAATNSVTKVINNLGWVTNRGTNFIGPASAALPTAVEYIHANFGHYFNTNHSIEIDKLDAGDFAGWTRTGEGFSVFSQPLPGTTPVCRFFTDSFGGKSSHFFAARGLGCEGALANPGWQYEGDVYSVRPPDSSGLCPAGTVPIYRMYNNGQGGAPNHRFSTKLAIRAEMLSEGWIAEGAGVGVGMCAPEP